MKPLSIHRQLYWNPYEHNTCTLFHVYDLSKPDEMLGATGSLLLAEKMASGKIPLNIEAPGEAFARQQPPRKRGSK